MKKVKIPTITVPPQPQKTAKSKKKTAAKGKANKTKLGRVIGHPPMDAVPPDILDTRPKIAPVSGKVVPKKEAWRMDAREQGEEFLKSEPPMKVVPPKATVTPAKRDVVMTGLIVQGQTCTWLGDLGEAGDDATNPERPVCPYCSGKLVHAGDQELARMGNRLYELGSYDSVNPPPRPHPNYVDFVAWMKSQPACWPTIEEAAFDYTQATGKVCDPQR